MDDSCSLIAANMHNPAEKAFRQLGSLREIIARDCDCLVRDMDGLIPGLELKLFISSPSEHGYQDTDQCHPRSHPKSRGLGGDVG